MTIGECRNCFIFISKESFKLHLVSPFTWDQFAPGIPPVANLAPGGGGDSRRGQSLWPIRCTRLTGNDIIWVLNKKPKQNNLSRLLSRIQLFAEYFFWFTQTCSIREQKHPSTSEFVACIYTHIATVLTTLVKDYRGAETESVKI